MRLLAWNIRAGGGRRLPRIGDALARHAADVIVLSEFRNGEAGTRLREMLGTLGYGCMTELGPPPASNGVLIGARLRFRERAMAGAELPEPHRMLAIDVDGLQLFGVYMPNLKAKIPYWRALIAALAAERERPAVAIGDFNTCRAYVDELGAIDPCAHFMDEVEAVGFCDLWRRRYPEGREYSWYSTRGNGFRIDHAFLSASLTARAGPVRYSHAEREAGLSDHSVLILDLE